MMLTSTTMTVELPVIAFQQLEMVAHQQRRSVREVVQDLILRSLPGLPQDVKDELATFASLSDDVLWLLARSTLTEEQRQELADLNRKAQRCSLTDEEKAHQQELIDSYNRVLVRRAEAARLLKSRGYDLSNLAVLQG
jgi:hypothetical protein